MGSFKEPFKGRLLRSGVQQLKEEMHRSHADSLLSFFQGFMTGLGFGVQGLGLERFRVRGLGVYGLGLRV